MGTRSPWGRLWGPKTSHWRGRLMVGMGPVFLGAGHGPGTAHPSRLVGTGSFKRASPPQASWELSVFPALNTQGMARSGTLTLGKGLPSPPVSLSLCRGAGMGLSPGHAVGPAGSGACPRPAAVPPARARRHLRGRGGVCGTGVSAFSWWELPGQELRCEVGSGAEAPTGGRHPGGEAAPQTSRLRAAAPAEAAASGPAAPLPLPPSGRTRRKGGGGRGGCASHRLLWPFCFAGGFQCRDVRGVTWGFLPPRWS